MTMLLQGIPVPPAPPSPETVLISSGPPPLLIGVVTVFAILVGAIILYPLVRALAKRLEGKAGGGEDARLVEARVAELEHRLADVEERLDFSERMLSQREPVALPRDKAD